MSKIQQMLIILMLCPLFTLSAMAADGPGRSARNYLKKSKDAYEKTDYKSARTNLEKAIEEFPEYAEAFYTLGQVDLQEKKLQQAISHFTKATAIDPGLSDAQLALARIYMAARQPGEALYRAELVLKKDASRLDALLIKGSALLGQKKSNEVIQLLEPLFNKKEHDPNLILLLTTACMQEGQTDRAENILNAGVEANPKAIALKLQLANLYLRIGNLKSAQKTMEAIVALDPDNINHTIALARLYRQTDENGKADQLLAQSLEQDPQNPAKRIAVANAYLESENSTQAQELLFQGINKGDPGAHLRLALGELYLKTGKAQDAVNLLKKGLDATPTDNPQERNNLSNALAKIYMAAGDANTANTYAEAVLDNDGKNVQALLTRGMALKAAGKPDQAVFDFERLLRLKPDVIDAYLQLADAYVRDNQLQKAKSTLDIGLRLAPRNQSLLMAAYRVSLRDKDYKHAEEYLRELLEAYPQAIDAQAELGDFYLALNDESSASREYSEIVLKSPRSVIGHLKLARLYHRQGKNNSAIEQLKKGYELTAYNPALATELTTALADADRHDDALALCDARLKKKPDDALAHDLKGKIYTSLKQYKKAQQSFEKAFEIDPTWPQTGNDLAALFLLQDKKDKAISQFEAALAKNQENPLACITLGKLYEEKRQYDKAIDTYEKGVNQIPGFWSGANRLAFLMADRATSVEALDKAHKIASAAYQMKPGQGAIIDTLAWIQYKKGETKASLSLYEKLIAAAPKDPEVNYHMGIVLKKAGDTKLARERLETATQSAKPFYGREHAEAVLRELQSKS